MSDFPTFALLNCKAPNRRKGSEGLRGTGLITDSKFKLLICSGNNNWNVSEKAELLDATGSVVSPAIYNSTFKDFLKLVGIPLLISLYKNSFDHFH